MFDLFGRKEQILLDEAIERILIDLAKVESDSKEYKILLDNLERLHKLDKSNRPMRVSPDAIVSAAASILGIVIIVAYEQRHVITSKGLGFVLKLK